MKLGAADTIQAFLVRVMLRLLSATWRYSQVTPEDCMPYVDKGAIAVVAFWHGKMFPIWYRFRNRGYAALISASRDGEILARYLQSTLHYRPVVRGSSSRNGGKALQEVVDVLAERSCLITPDGPRGPVRIAKPGALIAALRTGRPVLLCNWSASRSFILRSWDSMEIPYPFARVNFRYCNIAISPRAIETSYITEDDVRAMAENLNSLDE